MIHDKFLTFSGQQSIMTQEPLFTNIQNTFTIEFWAKPEATHVIDKQSRRGIFPTPSKRFAITPVFGAMRSGDHSQAGVGVSVGRNGVSVYEHTIDHLAPTLVFPCELDDWTHIAVVYVNKRPMLYINGKFMKGGLQSVKRILLCSGSFGGIEPYGFYVGSLKEIRIWNTNRTQNEIETNMNRELTGSEADLFGYWKLNEGAGTIAFDATRNKNDCIINGSKWNVPKCMTPSNKNMNILFTFFVPSGGVETLNRQRFYALNKNGVNCHFLYTQGGTGLQNKINTSIFVTNDNQEIQNIIKKENYDVIVVCSDLNLLQKIKNSEYKGLLIYDNQGLGFNKEYADYYLRNHARSIIENNCDAILFPNTSHLIEAFERNFPHKKKFYFNNCFDTKEFKYQVHPKHKNPIIGWVGRIEENKNWRDFLLIGSRLLKVYPNIQLWMFGDTTLGEPSEKITFEKKVDELNIRPKLTIYANQPHNKMAEYFSIIGDSGGFLCSTSKVESFGYAVLEAIVCKCPVLSTDSDGVRSFIKHNVTGKFFELGNINEAVREGTELMTNVRLREELRQNGVKYIEEHFSLEQYAENFFNMIDSLRDKN